jgi:hypothetical protein
VYLTAETGNSLVLSLVDITLLNVHRVVSLLTVLRREQVATKADVARLFTQGGRYALTPHRLRKDLCGGSFRTALKQWIADGEWKTSRFTARGVQPALGTVWRR